MLTSMWAFVCVLSLHGGLTTRHAYVMYVLAVFPYRLREIEMSELFIRRCWPKCNQYVTVSLGQSRDVFLCGGGCMTNAVLVVHVKDTCSACGA